MDRGMIYQEKEIRGIWYHCYTDIIVILFYFIMEGLQI